MSQEPLHLDWRNGPSSGTILQRIHEVLIEIDQRYHADIVVSGTLVGTPGAELQLVNEAGVIVQSESEAPDTRRMFVARAKTTKKRSIDYLLKLAVVAKSLVLDMDKRVPVASRLFGYTWTNRQIKKDAAISLATDLALTISVHPYLLGVVPDVDCRISVPKGWTIQYKFCTDIYGLMDGENDVVQPRKHKGPLSDAGIPSLIVSLDVERQKGTLHKPHAIMVFEHKNLKYMMQSLVRHGDKRFNEIFIVATGGFSDRGTREFLRLLTQTKEMQGVPCIFASDRDPHAMEIFSNLKYGTRRHAYESRITAVNEIQWGGVTIAMYTQLATTWPARELARWVRTRPNATQEDRNRQLACIERKTDRTMRNALQQPSALLNASDKDRIKHFHRYRVFSDQWDPKLYEDLLAMGMNELNHTVAVSPHAKGQKFALARLCQLNPHGIEECVAAIMKDAGVVNVHDTVMKGVALDEAREQWIRAGPNVDPVITHEEDLHPPQEITGPSKRNKATNKPVSRGNGQSHQPSISDANNADLTASQAAEWGRVNDLWNVLDQ